MKSLTEVARKSGFRNPPNSLSAVAKSLHFDPPYSMLKVAQRPATKTFYEEHISSGDVVCTFKFGISSAGHWRLTGSLIDRGALIGDDVGFQVALDYHDAEGRTATTPMIKTTLGGAIAGGSRTHEFDEEGIDPFIEANWYALSVAELKWSLEAGPSVAQIVYATFFFPVLAIGAVVVLFTLASGGSVSVWVTANDAHGQPRDALVIP